MITNGTNRPHPNPLPQERGQQSNVFFVTGLPRSRTGWLANLLTNGSSLCLHDGCRRIGKAADLARLFAPAFAEGYSKVGDSDSGLLLIAEEVAALYPEAKWVVVHRDPMEAAESYFQYFAREPYRGTLAPTWEHAREVFRKLDVLVKCMRDHVPSKRLFEVEFEELELQPRCHEVCQFLGVSFTRARFELLHGLRVNPASRKFEIDTGLARELVGGVNKATQEVLWRPTSVGANAPVGARRMS